jgi:hypothetical protein
VTALYHTDCYTLPRVAATFIFLWESCQEFWKLSNNCEKVAKSCCDLHIFVGELTERILIFHINRRGLIIVYCLKYDLSEFLDAVWLLVIRTKR